MKQLPKHHRLLFYGLWILINWLQAGFTELQDDEAYYWMFSKFLDWGYFDHPPMTALIIKMGYAIFASELGVRFFIVVLSTLTVYLCELLIEQKNTALFYAICLCTAVLQISGFMAVPDIPLMFFTALFFLAYRKFVQQSTISNTVLLAIVVAGLLYSKYHAVLIIFFTLLSNLKLLKRWQVYAAGLIALALYVPHLWWQYQHDWISFRYHLFESNVNPYKVSFTLDYIAGQLLIAGPLAGLIFWPATFMYRPANDTERALKYTAIGIFFFFFLSSFRGRVEANWTAPAIIGIIVLSHQYVLKHVKARQWVFRLAPITLVIVLAARFLMVVDLVPGKAVRDRFHQYKEWPQVLRQKTNGLPIVLSSSYQKASKYWFYSGQPTYSLNEYNKRRNNYNFWPVEDSLLGKPVFIWDANDSLAMQDSIPSSVGVIHYSYDSSFHSFTKIMIKAEERNYTIGENEPLNIKATVSVPPYYKSYLQQHPQIDFPVKLGVFEMNSLLKDIPANITLQQLVQKEAHAFTLPLQLPKGKYFLRFAIGSDGGWFTHNSDKINVEVR
ncbi:glycosyltransferase family 39 protein [Chitinophagaceae bacterium LB-8]|uniref:Glycosyltransferase family 39 protein n=1 Tax=Paraflavisolibacter caeni TaxID=2982496 RepID=A0A9X2XXI6_9BACT|nr:glycosyltransferase family 39 protein [Paraflavisolibacter caeni]MCU7550905.1 glycosyltransferase family 39 protein [Paraflavisolibacter caeni]